MKSLIMAAVLLTAAAPAALAQRDSKDANTPAVSTPNTTNPNAPVEGANSFTEGQARSRIESHGYTNVSDLKKDDKGIWRGRATRDGRQVNVSLDFQGNVTTN